MFTRHGTLLPVGLFQRMQTPLLLPVRWGMRMPHSYSKWMGDMRQDQVNMLNNRIPTALPPDLPKATYILKKVLQFKRDSVKNDKFPQFIDLAEGSSLFQSPYMGYSFKYKVR
ncbi:hypothetical protein [Citrobacter enshiensis]|uniref:hypothetical protein n=1 Tax=Citrobacter enshiensis TaxID=2971264 RepID=UPI00399D6E99